MNLPKVTKPPFARVMPLSLSAPSGQGQEEGGVELLRQRGPQGRGLADGATRSYDRNHGEEKAIRLQSQ